MFSEVKICNLALGWLGANTITSLDDESNEAELCNSNYEFAVRMALEIRDWTFATTRQRLTPLAVVPAFEYSYQFQLPADCIRTLSVMRNERGGRISKWNLEGRKILCNYSLVFLRYVKYVSDPTQYSPSFAVAAATALASMIAGPITENAAIVKVYDEKYTNLIQNGGSLDGLQGTSEHWTSSGLANARRSGVYNPTEV